MQTFRRLLASSDSWGFTHCMRIRKRAFKAFIRIFVNSCPRTLQLPQRIMFGAPTLLMCRGSGDLCIALPWPTGTTDLCGRGLVQILKTELSHLEAISKTFDSSFLYEVVDRTRFGPNDSFGESKAFRFPNANGFWPSSEWRRRGFWDRL